MINIFKRWFSHSKEQNIDDSQNPWAGLASYEDPETAERKLKFCGRDDDSYDLARLIMGNVLVTLYGKSGIGKTSLLNAGVFPELREEQYTPVSIRLGIRDEEHPQSYQTMIVEAVERVVKRIETINVINELQDQQSIDYLWNYFARHRFYDKYEELCTPVIVFDQFEEVFRGHRNEAETLLRQLDYLNDKDHTLDSCEVDDQPYRYEQNFRFVVSIREDDLYRLEDSIDNCFLPALKRCRYRLRSLSEQNAEAVILVPGEGLFKEENQKGIVDTIIDIARNKEDKSISTNVLSLICSRIFVDFKKSGTDHITPSLVDSFIKGNPFERFYNEATHDFSNKEKSYIEDNLVDSTGRRNSISESDFLLYVKNGAKLIEGENRILQRVSTSSDGDNSRIELIHDSFCDPLALQKEKREKRKRIKWLAFAAGIVATSLVILLLIISQNKRILQGENNLIQKNDSLNEVISQLNELKVRTLKVVVRHTLLDRMKECGCDKGFAYLVETKTGRIKVHDYIDLMSYEERTDTFHNEKCSMLYGPSYLSLLISDRITPESCFDGENGVYIDFRGNIIKDHNWHRGGYGLLTLEQALGQSSNVVFTKAIEEVYGNNLSVHDENIRRFCGGQENVAKGILLFYNTIANNGCMVKLINDGENVVVLDSLIAPVEHIYSFQQGLEKTVSEGLGKKSGSRFTRVAAKGRTFILAEKNESTRYRMEICGYFPAEAPQYTLMVVMEKNGLPASAGGQCGPVMSRIIEAALGIQFDILKENVYGEINPETLLGLPDYEEEP